MKPGPLSKAEHLAKARFNEGFFDALFDTNLDQQSTFPDWATTVLFYTALHYVDALCSDCGREFQSHEQRRRFIAVDSRVSAIYNLYRWLDDRSREARYQNLPSGTTASSVHSLKSTHLEPIKIHVQKQLRNP